MKEDSPPDFVIGTILADDPDSGTPLFLFLILTKLKRYKVTKRSKERKKVAIKVESFDFDCSFVWMNFNKREEKIIYYIYKELGSILS